MPAGRPLLERRNVRGRRVDYGLLQEESQHRGRLGEEFVFEYEKSYLTGSGHPDLVGLVSWVARDEGDGLGYDIRSCDIEGKVRYIEVKATAYDAKTPFYMTSAELDFAIRHQESYSLYRVYNILSKPEFYVLSGNIAEQTEKVPVTYKVSPILDRPEL
jgi:hypothetical protein